MDKKIAINLHDNKEYRFVIESDGSYFVLAPKRKTRGWRYSPTQFFNYYKIKETKTGLTENDKWKKRLKKAIALCKQNDLWHNLQEIWENLYNYVSLEEKRRIYEEYWACDRYNKEIGEQNYMDFVSSVKAKYPFMIKADENGKEHIITDYIWELSECTLKSMYFGKWDNAIIKDNIRRALAEKKKHSESVTVSYDVSFEYNPELKKAWYSEEYRNCSNGHYYLALSENTAVFAEND
ncbi:MAG: hypothetical protein IKB98_04810 [Clostridia bacterium]|nr:hypothetical protein [Clostridia bacterium]